MSIATAIISAQAKVAAAYSKCNDKGATMPVTQDLDHLDDCIDSIPAGGAEWFLVLMTSDGSTDQPIDVSSAQSAELAPCVNRVKNIASWFRGTALRDAVFTGITDIEEQSAFKECPQLRDVVFPDLITMGENGDAFRDSSIRSFSAPELTTIYNGFAFTFSGCRSLESVSFPKVTNVTGSNPFYYPFDYCYSLVSMTVHPYLVSNPAGMYNLTGNAPNIVNFRLSAIATDNVYIYCGGLDSASVLDVLNHLSTASEVTGKTCAFDNITIRSSDANYAAISAKVAALTNWTITGLTL